MTWLYLSPPEEAEQQIQIHAENCKAQAEAQLDVIYRAEKLIWKVLTQDGVSEIRQWLCNSVATIRSVSQRDHMRLFMNILRFQKRDTALQRQSFSRRLLRMLCENSPHKAGKLLSSRSRALLSFFRGNKRRILQWFDHFAGVGESEHKHGALSIAQFVFRNRDIFWEELEWKGKHGQSPAVVATKPHYFMDLEVLTSVENFIENVPEFWSSEEFLKSLEDGQIVYVDVEYFVGMFLHMMYDDDNMDIWDVVEDFLLEEKFSSLCPRLLIILNESELSIFLSELRNTLSKNCCNKCFLHSKRQPVASQSDWMEALLLQDVEKESLNDLLIVNACINHGRHIVRLLQEDEHEEVRHSLAACIREIFQNFTNIDHWVLTGECLRLGNAICFKLLAIKAWLLHYHLSQKCKTAAFCEELFADNRIEFNHHGNHASVDESSSINELRKKRKRKKDRSQKKKRKGSSKDYWKNLSDDEDIERTDDLTWISSTSEDQWFLATNDFFSPWNMVDLPEHLALHALAKWLNWVIMGNINKTS